MMISSAGQGSFKYKLCTLEEVQDTPFKYACHWPDKHNPNVADGSETRRWKVKQLISRRRAHYVDRDEPADPKGSARQ